MAAKKQKRVITQKEAEATSSLFYKDYTLGELFDAVRLMNIEIQKRALRLEKYYGELDHRN